MSSIRIKVQFGEDTSNQKQQNTDPLLKFIYVIEFPSSTTIEALTQALQKYINQRLATQNMRILQLATVDGFILPKSDLCSIVLKDDEHIICIDMKKCARDNYLSIELTKAWFEMNQHDLSDNHEKSIFIGLNTFSKLYVRLRGTIENFTLCMFDTYELMKIATEKRKDTLIGRIDNTDGYNLTPPLSDWFLECLWEYDANSNTNLFIVCNCKIGSEDTVISSRLQLILDHSRMRVKKGELTQLTGDNNGGLTLTDQQRQRLKELAAKLPPPKRTGPKIDTDTLENLKITNHECVGESSIRMAYGNTNAVDIYQERHSYESAVFTQSLTIRHIIFSKKSSVLPEILNQKRSQPVDKPVSVAGLSLHYQTHDGSWRECEDVAIAPIPIRNEETRWLTESVINIQPDRLVSFTIRGSIVVKGNIGNDSYARARSHKSLPQPLKLKIVVTDNAGKQCSLVVEQLNNRLRLPTRESLSEETQSTMKEFLTFASVDDVEKDERYFALVYINKKDELVIKTAGVYTGMYDRCGLRTMEYQAKVNKTPELEFDSTRYELHDNAGNVTALFDPETYILYAIRLELSSKTSKTEEHVFIPIEKIK